MHIFDLLVAFFVTLFAVLLGSGSFFIARCLAVRGLVTGLQNKKVTENITVKIEQFFKDSI